MTEYLHRKCNVQNYQIKHEADVMKERNRQLHKMGIDHTQNYDFPTYREIVRQAIVKRFGTEPQLEMP